jgi:hypothetical protein
MGHNHPNIHVVDFKEEIFKGVLLYAEALQILHDVAAREELQAKQEEMKKFHQDLFQRFLQEDQNKLFSKDQYNIKKDKELEKKRLETDVEYQRKQAEAESKKIVEEVEAERRESEKAAAKVEEKIIEDEQLE